MKKYLLLFSVLVIGLSACNKGKIETLQANVDDAKIQAYMKANNITAIKDPSGYYYQILVAGTGTPPVSTSTVKVTYVATFLDGVGFDSGSSSSFLLSGSVVGFQSGLEHIGTGGRIKLIIPSALGYGAPGSGSVPANAVLVFTIDLLGYY